eukprot:Blabericola_migrator_1__2622@NODE_1740_length_3892_cov_166_272418_g1124_i0_p1_GENE_NODE_1740_length_3892_cov_166_272418_g1124_i0NODE_1740_length_3892_cov_166_272418_g1124_i0_p1_ORF_typecomplete_len694_score117_42PrePUA/PF17832_1/4_3e12SUI1/PF01253_22/8_9e10PUA/PF01472_20/6_6e08INT_SG_DDX_CT_C/PF15300_6/0_061Skp1_POZ/PF03931_15/0_29_NODE_1740_length_3892_cov_166_272418_g1124_i013273408
MFKPKSQSAQQQLVGRRNVVGDRDRKSLRNAFLSQFPSHTVEVFNGLFPPDDQMTVLSLKGCTAEVYYSDECPMFFSMSKKKGATLIPTLFTLWRVPDLLPVITCQAQAPRFLIRGADLMLPGCIPPLPANIMLGKAYSVCVTNNPVPFAVGTALMDQEELQSASKGKILEIQHVLGDLLFKSYPDVPFPPGFAATTCAPLTESEGGSSSEDSDSDAEEAQQKSLDLGSDNEATPAEPPSRMDSSPRATESASPEPKATESRGDSDSDASSDTGPNVSSQLLESVIEYCVLEVLKKQLPDSALPIDVSAVWGKVSRIVGTVVSAPVGLRDCLNGRDIPFTDSQLQELQGSLDLKKTSWRNLKKMANHFKRTKIWQTKELRGVVTIVKINRVHPIMMSHKTLPDDILPPDVPVKNPKGSSKSDKKKGGDDSRSHDHASGGSSSVSFSPITAYQGTAQSKELLVSVGAYAEGTSSDALFLEADVARLVTRIMQRLNSMPSKAGDMFPSLDGDSSDADKAVDESPYDPNTASELLTRDSRMLNICLTKAERQAVKTGGPVPKMTEAQICKRFMANGMKVVTLLLNNSTAIEQALKDPSSHGLIEADAKITISTQRTKRFTRTKVAGIHLFPSIDPKQLADRLQKACAASATVCELDEMKGKSKPLGVIVQGAVVQEVCDVLEKQYGVPRTMLVLGA